MVSGIRFLLPPKGSLVPISGDDPLPYYYVPLFSTLYVQRIRTVLSLLPEGFEASRVVELGYGSGVLIPSLAPHVDHYYGVDILPPQASLLSNLGRLGVDTGKVTLIDADILETELEPVDLVLAISMFEHIRDPRPLLEALRRMLAPGGLLMVGMPRLGRMMSFVIKNVLRYKRIDHEHVTCFQNFLEASAGSFTTLARRNMPAFMPDWGALYHAALLRPLQ